MLVQGASWRREVSITSMRGTQPHVALRFQQTYSAATGYKPRSCLGWLLSNSFDRGFPSENTSLQPHKESVQCVDDIRKQIRVTIDLFMHFALTRPTLQVQNGLPVHSSYRHSMQHSIA
jgi:hypothetical protein